MDRAEYVQKRKKKYMAQVLEKFEEAVEPHLPEAAAAGVQDFKGLVRARMNALAVDATEIFMLADVAQNQAAQDLRDQLSATGRP